MNYIELFGGIGGFSYGIKKATENMGWLQQKVSERNISQDIENQRGNDNSWKCSGYYEIDKYAVQTYNKNFGTSWKPADIRKVPAESVPDHDVLCAGFPCQSFSIAGKRKGFVDTRGTLFFEICRIAQSKRPKILFLENVKGLLNHDEGRTFATILLSLYELGYFVEWQVLNSKHFGVPQNRERVFIIGHLGGEPRQKVFPLGEGSQVFAKENGGQQGERERICSTIDSRYGALRNAGETYMVERTPLKFMSRNQKNIEGDYAFTVDGSNTGGVMLRDGRDNRSCLKSGRNLEVGFEGQSIRRLTPKECERLQGFPDGWTEGVSDTQRYKQLGNAVTTNVIQAIMEKMIK